MLGAPRSAPRAPPDRLGHLGQFQRHLAAAIATHSPLPRVSSGASSTRPPPRMSAHPTQLSAAPAPSHPPSRPSQEQILRWDEGSSWRGGWAGRHRKSSREAGMETPKMNRTSLPSAEVLWAATQPPPPVAVSPLSSSQIPIVRTLPGSGTSPKERRLKRNVSGGYLPFFSRTVQHRALGACEGTRAHTRAHTPGSLDHALLALRPSALPPVKTQRSTLPSHRAPRAGFATNQQSGK